VGLYGNIKVILILILIYQNMLLKEQNGRMIVSLVNLKKIMENGTKEENIL
jgi:hypothetical protein